MHFSVRAFALHAISKELVASYKATTVDECIQEKECVWYHFLLATQVKQKDSNPTEEINIKKWTEPLLVRPVVKAGHTEPSALTSYLEQIIPFMMTDVKISQKYNYLVLITDDTDAELRGGLKTIFDSTVGSGVVQSVYDNLRTDYEKKCFYVPIQHTEDPQNLAKYGALQRYVAVIQSDISDMKKCLREVVYAGTGLVDIADSALVKKHYSSSDYSLLELMLIFIFYQDYYRPGMSYDEIKVAFDSNFDFYRKEITNFKAGGGAN